MQEQLITFETAKLANLKGFDPNIKLKKNSHYNSNTKALDALGIQGSMVNYHYYAATQGLLQKWLREVHNIDCLPMLNLNNEYSCHIFKNKLSINKDRGPLLDFIVPNGKDYFKVFEEGLYEALKLIENGK